MADGAADGATKLRLAYVCAGDPLNVLSWSGTPYYMLEALRREFEVVEVIRQPWASWFTLLRKVFRRLSGGTIDLYWWPALTRIAAARALDALERAPADVVFVVAASPIGAEIAKRRPVAYFSDATFDLITNYNLALRRLAPPLKRSAHMLESRCLQDSLVSLLPSDWARNSAIHDHGGDPNRIFVVPWGANLPAHEVTPPEARSKEEWRLLFVGIDWVRKGGDVALATVAEMQRRGHKVHLDIVGSLPPEPVQAEGVTFHGFLDKRNDGQRRKLEALFRDAHIFFLPTRAEALGIVFAEAASYALPAVSYRTGGISAMVVDGETGLLLEEGAPPEAFADAMIDLLSDWDRYLTMAHAAPERSKSTLNWPAWAREVRRTVTRMLDARGASSKDAGGKFVSTRQRG